MLKVTPMKEMSLYFVYMQHASIGQQHQSAALLVSGMNLTDTTLSIHLLAIQDNSVSAVEVVLHYTAAPVLPFYYTGKENSFYF